MHATSNKSVLLAVWHIMTRQGWSFYPLTECLLWKMETQVERKDEVHLPAPESTYCIGHGLCNSVRLMSRAQRADIPGKGFFGATVYKRSRT